MGSHRRRLQRLATEFARAYPEIDDPDAFIVAEGVLVGGRIVTNPASLVRVGTPIALPGTVELRGEAKLRAALAAFGVRVSKRVALDLGAAAGGFTRVLLDAGASRVYAVDAGFGQLLGSVRQDARVVDLERTNLGELSAVRVPDVIDVITVDLSYLAIATAVPQLAVLQLAPDADLVALVKPMFELGLAEPPTNRNELARAVSRARDGLEASGWRAVTEIESPVRGRNGSIEYLVHARRAPPRTSAGGA